MNTDISSKNIIQAVVIIVAIIILYYVFSSLFLGPSVRESPLTPPLVLNPQVNNFVKTLTGGTPIYQLTPNDARNVLETIQNNAPQKLPDNLKVTDTTLNGVSVRIVSTTDTLQQGQPIILYIHGGGWILGSANTHNNLIQQLVAKTSCSLVFVNYSRSPEAKYPTAVNEIYNVLSYINQNIKPSKLIIIGDSVGGNMAIAETTLAIRNNIKVDMLILFYPVTDDNFDTGSYLKYADGPWLTKKAMMWFWDAYAPPSVRNDILVTPLKAPASEFTRFPPTLIVTDENDVLRDEGEAFARKLEQAQVPVFSLRVIGTIHDFLMLNPLATSTPTTQTINIASQKIKQLIATGFPFSQ